MSSQGAQPSGSRVRRLQLVAIAVLAILFAVQVAYQLLFADRTFADLERMKVLARQAHEDSGRQAASTGVWPQWRGPRRDGVSYETGLLDSWPGDGPRKIWQQPAGIGYSSFAVAGGRLFTLMQDGDSEAVFCWNADDGNELWRYRYPAKFESADGSGPRATPTVDGDLVYTVGGTGIMNALKVNPASSSGEVVWHKDLLADFGARNLRWGTSLSPLVVGDLVYINPGGRNGNSIAALDKRTGAVVWKSLDDPAGYSSPVEATLAGQKQIVFFTATGLVGATLQDGKLLWRFPWETSYGCNIATPIVVGDYVFVSSGYNRGCAVVHIEKIADAFQARRVYENHHMSNHFSSSVYFRGYLYGFNDARLTCMDFGTGEVKWRESSFGKGSLLVADGRLIILGETGKLALADATPEGYHERASDQISNTQCWVVPVLAAGRLYVRDAEKVMCLDLRSEASAMRR
jgi:outer membrane protein assembly factor BamB